MENRIKEWRIRRGLSAQALAERLDPPSGRSTIVKLERGERKLTPEWMHKLGSALDIAPVELLPPQALAPISAGVIFAPVCTWAEARKARDSNFRKLKHLRTVPVPYHRETIVAIEVLDDSMDRVCPPGAQIIVDVADVKLVDRGIYALVLPDNGQETLREYRDRGGPRRLMPKSSNPRWEPLYLDEAGGGRPLDVIGRVKLTFTLLDDMSNDDDETGSGTNGASLSI